MTVKIKSESAHPLPHYQTEGSSGVDLYANIQRAVRIEPKTPEIIPTGVFVEIPHGYEAQIRSRSGLAAKHGVFCLNSPGTIDSDYRGEIKVILSNASNQAYSIKPGERIAQMVFSKVEIVEFDEVSVLEDTARGDGGFGHTGK